jgi:ketosteroid isomerase-like protein
VASQNLELVRSIYAAREHGDYGSADWAHPEIEFVLADGPTPGSCTGVAAMAKAWREFLSAWDNARPEVEEYRELDDERVLMLGHIRGRGKTSGLELGQVPAKVAAVYHVRDGKVVRLVAYFDRDRAFADLGLRSQDR